jgi:hypothetical protein
MATRTKAPAETVEGGARKYTVKSPLFFGRGKGDQRRYEIGEAIELAEEEAALIPAHVLEEIAEPAPTKGG